MTTHDLSEALCVGMSTDPPQVHDADLSADVDANLPSVGGSPENYRQGHDEASRPPANGVGAPAGGLADRKDTTD